MIASKSAGLSQDKLAERMGVRRQAVTKWETGQSASNTENLLKLAEIYRFGKLEDEKEASEKRMRKMAGVSSALKVLLDSYTIP